MSATFSSETQELLDRAERAIERSIEARRDSAKRIAEAQNWVRSVETNIYRANTLRKEAAQRR
jgi:hypothetical protein